ncbi:MAG: hypothetical protein QW197_03725 [Candidatus Aenigmatarchaeota archaeon]
MKLLSQTQKTGLKIFLLSTFNLSLIIVGLLVNNSFTLGYGLGLSTFTIYYIKKKIEELNKIWIQKI